MSVFPFFKRQYSLSDRIIAYILAAITCFSLVVGGGSFLLVQHLLNEQINTELNFDLQKAILDVEQPLNNAITHLQQLSKHPLLANGLTDSLGRETYLKPFFLEQPLAKAKYGELLLADFSGYPLLTTSQSLQEWLKNTSLIQQAIATNLPQAEAFINQQLVIVYPVIFPPTGHTEGLVVYRINLTQLIADVTTELSSTLELSKRDESIADFSTDLKTTKELKLSSPLDTLNFKLTVKRSKEIAMRPLNYATQGYIFTALLLLMLAALISKRVSRNVLKNLNRLILQMDSVVNTKEIPQQTDLLKGDTEIQQLGHSFNHLLARLNQSYAELENKVVERTIDLHKTQEHLKGLLSTSPVGVFETDAQGNCIYVNARWSEITGLDFEQAKGSGWKNALYPEDVERVFSEWITASQERRQFYLEYRFFKDNQITWVLGQSTPLYINDEITGYIGTITDISVIQKAKTQAEASAAFKTNFLTNMSHEIRTPMNAIVGLSSLALNKQVTPEIRDYLEKIYSSSEGLLNILNDILDFAKLEAGRMTIEHHHFDLENVLVNVHNLFAVRAEEKGLKLDVLISPRVPLHLIGDELRLQQILINLLGNAIKFTEQGCVTVKVDLVRSEASQAQLLFSVQDTGIGIADEDIEKLFKPFSQADGSITRRFGGTGLGLAISHNLLELMGSDIKIDSEVDKGTCFSFELVLGVSSDSTSLYHEIKQQKFEHRAGELSLYLNKPSHNLAGTSLLVVEDNKINQQVIKEFLELSGISVVIANHGKEALAILETQTFDAILMDVHMPEMDGFETTQHIRQIEKFKTLPVIALTAGVTQEEHQHCLDSGMNDFVAKPIVPEQLISALSRWIRCDSPIVGNWSQTNELTYTDLKMLEGFELNNLLTMLGGNQEKVIQLLLDFKTDMITMPAEIKACIEQQDLKKACELAHKLKGVASNLGAMTLHKIVQQLESELKAGEFNQATFDLFNTQFDKTIAIISTLT